MDEELQLTQSTSKAESVELWQLGQSMLRVYMHCFVRQQIFAEGGKMDGVPAMPGMRWFL